MVHGTKGFLRMSFKATDVKMGKLSWIILIDPILSSEPLKTEFALAGVREMWWKRKRAGEVRELPVEKRLNFNLPLLLLRCRCSQTGTGKRTLGDMASLHLTKNKGRWTSDLNLANHLNELGSGFFPSASDEEPTYPDTLMLAWRLFAPLPKG